VTSFSEEKEAKDFLKGQGKGKAYSKKLLPQKPGGTDARLFSFARVSAFISSRGSKTPSFSEEKEAKDFLKGQGKGKAYSKKLLPQKPGGTDARLFPFAQYSAFISSLGSKNARYAPGVFRFSLGKERP